MPGSQTAGRRFRFGGFVLDLERGVLHGPDGELRLRPKSDEVLRYLLLNPGRLVTKKELLHAVWGHTVVTEDSLIQCLVEIRRAIGDHGREVIRTVPRRGYMLDVPVIAEPAESRRVISPPRSLRRSGAAVLVMAAAVAFAWLYLGQGVEKPARSLSQASSPAAGNTASGHAIAVLPFADMSAAGNQDYFGEGIAEEILNLLAQVDSLRVIARTSSFAFQGRAMDVRDIAGHLGVTHVLEGSVRRSGDRVRITAQLVDGRDGVHLWSQVYDREVGDVFALQLEIAQQVSARLAATLQVEQPVMQRNIRAYEHLLRGRFLYQRRAPGDMERAREHFEAAIALDPDDGAAWAALSAALTIDFSESRLEVAEALPRALAAAERGVALSPGLPEAHLRAARAYRYAGDVERALHHVRVAEALNPDDVLLLGLKAGIALARDDLAGALNLQERVVARDPLSAVARGNYAAMLQAAGRLAEARAQLLAVLEISPGRQDFLVELAGLPALEGRHEDAIAALPEASADERSNVVRAVSLHALGRHEEARAAALQLEQGTSAKAALCLAEVHAQRGETDAAWHWLEEARRRMQLETLDSDTRWRQMVRASGFLRPLEDDPRWRAAFRVAPGAG